MPIVKQQHPVSVTEDERENTRDFDGLCASLNNEDHKIRRWAVRDLAQYQEASPVLAARLTIETDTSVRTVILDTLAKFGDETAISAIVNCLRSDDASFRNEAIDVLKNIPEEVAPIIENLLKDDDSDVRIFAVNILESLRHEDVEKWLIDVIEHDSHVNVCSTAVDLLSEVGTENAIQALKNLKQRFANEPYVCFSVDLALKRIQEGG